MLAMVRALSLAGSSLKESALMFFATFWALVLGFGLSGIVQSFFRKNQIENKLGTGSFLCTLRASVFGFASSSCSYAASAMSKSIFQKGADFVSANVFMFASTNLVIELGVVLAILMGWQFLLAEFIGGVILITLFSLIGKVVFPRKKQVEILKHLNEVTLEAHGVTQDPFVDDRTFKTKLLNAASYAISDIKMLKYELLIGFIIAGIISSAVPIGFWKVLFISNHGALTDLENALVGPIIATFSFVCSVGNIPLAAALYKDGISFSGVMAFIFADLITVPLLMIYKKFYGLASTVKMYISFYAVMAVTGELTNLIFKWLNIVPLNNKIIISKTTFGFNFDFYTDLIFVIIFTGMLLAHFASTKLDSGFAIDPVCNMQVDKLSAAASSNFNGANYYFCSPKCKERFDENPQKYIVSNGSGNNSSEPPVSDEPLASEELSIKDDIAIDPVCNMQVDKLSAAASSNFNGADYYFCCESCKLRFDENPQKYIVSNVSGDKIDKVVVSTVDKVAVSLIKRPNKNSG